MCLFKMGFLFSKLWNSKKEVLILMVGLDGAGKTTILYHLGKGEKVKTLPIIGYFQVETLNYKDMNFISFNVGGADRIKYMLKSFYKNTEGLIFVVDSNDRDRIEDAAEELKRMLAEEELKDCCVLVMANKQDVNGAVFAILGIYIVVAGSSIDHLVFSRHSGNQQHQGHHCSKDQGENTLGHDG